ncbi:MAG: polyphosphate kinase [Verrucomicrobiota bacterium]
MFLTAELGRTIPDAEYDKEVPAIREALLTAQQRVRHAPFPVIILFGGVDGAGKSETINLLNAWMDPRWLMTRAYGEPSQEMLERPEFWRYWRDLPPKGRIALFQSSWYSQPILDRVYEETSEAEFDEALERVASFEKENADDGALIIKFWMHLGKDAQNARFKELEADPLTRWRVQTADWEHWKKYDQFVAAAERAIMRTSNVGTPWHIVEGFDENYRSLTVAKIILESIEQHFEKIEIQHEVEAARKARNGKKNRKDKKSKKSKDKARRSLPADTESNDPFPGTSLVPDASPKTILNQLDMSLALDKDQYAKLLEEHQGALNQQSRKAKQLGISTLLVFEGWDAAGKGGSIRRVVAALDARGLQVIPIAAPTDEEKAHHYLWRFWRHLSRAGRVTIFDRSWYGRVLVERIEGYASETEWKRAYAEINDFEEQIVRHGIVLCKFWMHITKDEQLERFKEREKIPYKRWKLTDDDWRNRDRWNEYELAVNDMIERTSTVQAPWTLVEANDKRFARIKVLETITSQLKARLD